MSIKQSHYARNQRNNLTPSSYSQMTLNIFAEIELHPHVNIASYTVVHDKGHLEKDAET